MKRIYNYDKTQEYAAYVYTHMHLAYVQSLVVTEDETS